MTFEPGARTAWHTHPLGQTLVVISGLGWVQRERGSIEEIRPGDIIWFAPREKHWHGATSNTAMTHLDVFFLVGFKARAARVMLPFVEADVVSAPGANGIGPDADCRLP